MVDDLLRVELRLEAEAGTDEQEIDDSTRRLRSELLELDVTSVDRIHAGPAPAGARALDVMAVGALAVSMLRSPDVLKAVIGGVQGWLAARHSGSVEMKLGDDTIKVSGLSSAEQDRLIDLFVARHTS